MSDTIEFVTNYNDLSTDRGFQFEFNCNRCGAGFRTPFKATASGVVTDVLDTAGGIFGGILGTAASVSGRVHSAGWQRAHDAAFTAASHEMRPNFIQCPRCQSWVCRESCWNLKKGYAKSALPTWVWRWRQHRPAVRLKKSGRMLPWPRTINIFRPLIGARECGLPAPVVKLLCRVTSSSARNVARKSRVMMPAPLAESSSFREPSFVQSAAPRWGQFPPKAVRSVRHPKNITILKEIDRD